MSDNKQLTDIAKQGIINLINGMSDYELEIVVDTIPVEKCLERISRELDKAAAFDKQIKDVMSKYGKSVNA